MFFARSYEKEIMDNFTITDERINNALKELSVINRFLGGHSTTKKGIQQLLNDLNTGGIIKILDAGAGDSDNFRNVNIDNKVFEIHSLDINHGACKYTRDNGYSLNVVCGDVKTLPYRNSSFDFVHASLFLHHFKEEDIIFILKRCMEISNKGIIINDLHRSIFAFTGIKILTLLFSKSKMVKNDGPLSVRRGFLKKELIDIITKAGFSSFVISHHWAFRWLVVIKKNEYEKI